MVDAKGKGGGDGRAFFRPDGLTVADFKILASFLLQKGITIWHETAGNH